tara:strand:- start:275 stop:991 length:717 start_codon:yes stop_codon:yes gene_type:complete
MKKTFTLLTTCLLLSTPLKAEGENLSQSGFFIGAQAGYNYLGTKVDTTSSLADLVIPVISSVSDRKFVRVHSFIGGGLFGYLWSLNRACFAGVELEGNFDNMELKKRFAQNGQNFQYNICRQFNLVPSFIIGAYLHERLKCFLKLGFALSSLDYSVKNITDGIKISHRRLEVGFAPSLVQEFQVNKNIAVLATATYEFYKKSNVTFLGTISPVTPVDNNVLKARLNNFSLKFGLKYYI